MTQFNVKRSIGSKKIKGGIYLDISEYNDLIDGIKVLLPTSMGGHCAVFSYFQIHVDSRRPE
jgi:hypothetical protein